MAAHVLRLRFALLLGALRGERRIRTLLSFGAVVAVTVVVCVAVFSLTDASVPVASAVTVLGGAAVLLGFLVGPLLVGRWTSSTPVGSRCSASTRAGCPGCSCSPRW